jgi:hypothetical protein
MQFFSHFRDARFNPRKVSESAIAEERIQPILQNGGNGRFTGRVSSGAEAALFV